MGNCFVTKLKEVVNNDSLPKLGVFKIGVIAGTVTDARQQKLSLRAQANKTITVKTTGGGYFAKSYEDLSDPAKRLTSLEITWNEALVDLWFSNDNYFIEISEKYDILMIQFDTTQTQTNIFSVDINHLYAIDIRLFTIQFNSNVTGDISSLSTSEKLDTLILRETSVTGNINVLEGKSNLQILNLQATNVFGDIDSFNVPASATVLSVGGCPDITGHIASIAHCVSLAQFNLHGSGVSGDIEDFVSGQVAAGRTTPSSSLLVYQVLNNLTFGGTKYTDNTSYRLTWNDTTKITLFNNNSIEAATIIYAKGATAEEIAAWQQAGKNVVIVS